MVSNEKKVLKQAYNNFAEHRDQTDLAPWKQAERMQFLARMQQENRRTLLEIGAGPGRDSLYFQQNGLNVTAIDFSEEMVRLCRNKGLQAYVMDFYRLDFPHESFDAVFALNCLLHVPKAQLDLVFQQIRKVLKPKGLFFLGLYGGKSFEGIWGNDTYEPKRFFSLYEDAAILGVVQQWFHLEDFHTVNLGEGTPHFQSILLRKMGNSEIK